MTTVRDLLKGKGNEVWSIPPETTVLEALEFMSAKDIGAVLVTQNDQIVGIISERDFVRSIAGLGMCLIHTPVSDYMTKNVFYVGPDQTIDECMQLMTAKKIRHLPVLENNAMVGLISIGDVVKELISSKESTINLLENYIQGRGYGQ
jgi:CBS domain-containing protein